MSDADRAPANVLPLSDLAVVREYVRDVLDSFNADHVGATKFLHAMPLPDGASEDAVVVETLFTEMLALPVAVIPAAVLHRRARQRMPASRHVGAKGARSARAAPLEARRRARRRRQRSLRALAGAAFEQL
jgi:hypothetical protein